MSFITEKKNHLKFTTILIVEVKLIYILNNKHRFNGISTFVGNNTKGGVLVV